MWSWKRRCVPPPNYSTMNSSLTGSTEKVPKRWLYFEDTFTGWNWIVLHWTTKPYLCGSFICDKLTNSRDKTVWQIKISLQCAMSTGLQAFSAELERHLSYISLFPFVWKSQRANYAFIGWNWIVVHCMLYVARISCGSFICDKLTNSRDKTVWHIKISLHWAMSTGLQAWRSSVWRYPKC